MTERSDEAMIAAAAAIVGEPISRAKHDLQASGTATSRRATSDGLETSIRSVESSRYCSSACTVSPQKRPPIIF